MGLDMYLYRANKKDAEIYDNLTKEEKNNAQNPWLEVAYWRKSNQIRKWFVDHCGYPEDGNCDIVDISKDDIEQLINDCVYVLENRDLSNKIMQVSAGFFFGARDYGDWYYEDLIDTVDMCNKVLEETDWDKEKVIYTDWW